MSIPMSLTSRPCPGWEAYSRSHSNDGVPAQIDAPSRMVRGAWALSSGPGTHEGWGRGMTSADDAIEALRRVPPFDVLPEDVFDGLTADVRVVEVAPGTELVRVGEPATELYVLLDGEVAVIGPGESGDAPVLATLGAGAIVGEIAVLAGGHRSATLRATSPVTAVAVDGQAFVTMLDRSPELGRQLASVASSRLHETRLASQLQRLFPGPGAAALGATAGELEPVSLQAGEVLFRAGEPADAAYIVVTGRVRVLADDQDGELVRPIPEIGSGELVGEVALLDGAERSATVVAARDSRLARLPIDRFEALAVARPEGMLAVMRTLVTRLRDTRDPFRRAASDHASVGLLPITPSVDLGWLAEELETRLTGMTSATRVTPQRAERELANPGIAQARPGDPDELRLERWLEEVESEHAIVLLQGDAEVSPWTRRCVDHVDHLVLVADVGDPPQVTELERMLLSAREVPHQRVSLVLLHPAGTQHPSGTAAWLEPRDVDDHLHVRRGHARDLDRLGRHLAGRSVWLVLGGGGGKGFAHLGVVRAMEDVGLPVDGIVGVSMGAQMGAVIAQDTPPDELVARTDPLFANLLDYTIPISGLISGRRIAAALERACEGRDIEDLWHPYVCVSANLTRSRLVVHRRGDLARSLRASCSLPGVMPPVAVDGDLLVDGGVMNNLPVDIARRYNPTGIVIASDVAPPLGPRAKADHGLSVSGGRVLLQRLTPGLRAPPVPRIVPTLMRSLILSSAEARDRGIEAGLADLHLAFELRGVGLLDFDRGGDVAQRGYDESIEQLTAFAASVGAVAP